MDKTIVIAGLESELALRAAKLLIEQGVKEVTVDSEADFEGYDYTLPQEPCRPSETTEYRADKAQWKREKNSHKRYWR